MSQVLTPNGLFFFGVSRLTVNRTETLSSSISACLQTEKARRSSLDYDQKNYKKILDVLMSLFCGGKNHYSI